MADRPLNVSVLLEDVAPVLGSRESTSRQKTTDDEKTEELDHA